MFGGLLPLVVVDHAVPFFVLGAGLWAWVLLANVPRSRWSRPGHWLKAAVCTSLITVGLVPVSLVLGWGLAASTAGSCSAPASARAPHRIHRAAQPGTVLAD